MLDGSPPIRLNAPVSAFATEFARLNAAQRRAVEHPDGPVLVVAGPGTGKTQLLAARVAWLLQHPELQVQAPEILCLTYTEAAAHNMRQRLLRFIGPEAHRVAIHTFHSFCHQLIQENADYFGYHDLAPVSGLETEDVLRQLIDALPAGHVLRRVGEAAYYEVPRLSKLFAVMKKEGWSPAHLAEAIRIHVEELPNRAEYQYKNSSAGKYSKGDPRQGLIDDETKRMAALAAGVEQFEPYREALRARSRYDFDDMLGWTLQAFAEQPELLLRYQERYQHILVDEYQDTNGAQNRILHTLASYWDNPNIFAVGDDDQSIFRFQGASVANVLDFTRQYPHAAVVVLEDNYRSSAAVLQAATALIERNQERLVGQLPGLSKMLHARHPIFADAATPPAIRRFPSPLHEAAYIAAELEALHRAGFPLHQCAVLSHDHGQVDDLATLLTVRGVPFARRRKVNILAEEPLARGLRAILTYLAAELQQAHGGEPHLFQLLHLDALRLAPIDCARLAAGLRRHNQGLPLEQRLRWREWLFQVTETPELAATLQLSPEALTALGRVVALLERWLTEAASLPLPALSEHICLETLLPHQLATHPQPDHLLDVVRTLLQFVRTECRRQPMLTLEGLLEVMVTLERLREGLPLERSTGTASAGVQLLTAHGAKGLEFERVWLIGCHQSVWLKTKAGASFTLPDALLPGSTDSPIEEARRLFFVGLTRAQEHLLISTCVQDQAGKGLADCEFITELQQYAGLTITDVAVPADELLRAQRELLPPPPPPAALPDFRILDELLADYSLSATHLHAYLKCPMAFYYEQVLRVPSPRNERLHFGSSMHYALEQAFRQAQADASLRFPDAETLATTFADHFRRSRHELPVTTYERYLHHGRTLLAGYHARYAATWPATAVVEHIVRRAVLPSGIVLNGKLDRLDPRADGRGHDVLDYKTGKWNKYDQKRRAAALPVGDLEAWRADEKARGGDYWRQAIFCHLLLIHDVEQRFTPVSVAFDYLEPGTEPGQPTELKREYIHITPADEQAVLAQIQAVDAAIRRREFSQGCAQPKCAWCQLRG
ncbi:ATP-dependent DNA helicase [Hymenobacter fastidiosus]|uniref:DNA 3'-5' helicase n=1 Tax=Hymenobacter fastidiosus TaxID=486264 RepID=A0ABP7T3P8_9BACT